MSRSFARYTVCLLAILLIAGCSGTRQSVQRADRAMAPGSVVAPESAQWDTPASLLSGNSPLYPIEQLMTGKAGYAEVAFTVDPEGKTRDIEVVRADQPAFGNHLAIAVKGWRFEPSRKDGHPVASRLEYGLCFQIVRNFNAPREPRDGNSCAK